MNTKTIIIALVIVLLVAATGIFFASQGTEVVSTQTATSTQNGTQAEGDPATINVDVALIALEDNGASGKKIGCDDSVVLVGQDVPFTQGTLRAALEELLSMSEDPFGELELYNALAQSSLTLDDVSINGGTATIEISGTPVLGGTCDTPRFEAQIEETALQFDSVSSVNVLINGEPMHEVLSQQ